MHNSPVEFPGINETFALSRETHRQGILHLASWHIGRDGQPERQEYVPTAVSTPEVHPQACVAPASFPPHPR